jgi:proteic killer suppression protein
LIASFGDQATADLYHGVRSARARRFPRDVVQAALRKLDMLNSARNMNDMRSPPGNRLEALRRGWRGFHSVRINDQWRVVFRWSEGQAHDVRVIDYHRG